MPLTTVLTMDVRMERMRKYEQLCLELAEHAKEHEEARSWMALQGLFGDGGRFHFITVNDDWAAIAQAGRVDETVRAAMGDDDGARWLGEAGECIAASRHEVLADRPELSYVPDQRPEPSPFAVVTVARARPGHQEGAEELIRKIAEAIPKTDDASRLETYQTLVGNLTEYTTVRRIESLADIDRFLPAPQLLDQAFGPAEGGLIYRSGMDAIENVERSIVAYRPELSHSPS